MSLMTIKSNLVKATKDVCNNSRKKRVNKMKWCWFLSNTMDLIVYLNTNAYEIISFVHKSHLQEWAERERGEGAVHLNPYDSLP